MYKLGGIMLIEMSQIRKGKNCIILAKYLEAESRKVITSGGRWGKWGGVGQRVGSCRYVG